MRLFFSNVVVETNQIWMLAPKQSLLCEMDKRTKKIKIVADLDAKEQQTNGLYYGIIKVNDCIYVYPDRAKHIAVYHIKTGEIEYIDINWGTENLALTSSKIGMAYFENNYLYFIGKRNPVVIKMDITTLEQKLIHIQIENEMWRKSVQIQNKIYIPSLFSRKIVIFDVSTDDYQINEVPINTNGIACVLCRNNQLIIVPTDLAKIYELDVGKWIISKKYDLSKIAGIQCPKNEIPFMHLFMDEVNYWLFPWKANMIVKINRINEKAESVYAFNDETKCRYINAFQWDDSHIFGYYAYGDSLDICNIKTDKVERYPNKLPVNMEVYWKNEIKKGNNEIIDESDMGLSCFLKMLYM